MTTPTEERQPLLDQEFSDIVATLILDPPVPEPQLAPRIIYVDRQPPVIAPSLFEEKPERFWNGDPFWFALLAIKYLGIMGVIAIVGQFIILPIASVVIAVGPALVLMAVVGVVLFWATQLMGFWDHSSPAQAG